MKRARGRCRLAKLTAQGAASRRCRACNSDWYIWVCGLQPVLPAAADATLTPKRITTPAPGGLQSITGHRAARTPRAASPVPHPHPLLPGVRRWYGAGQKHPVGDDWLSDCVRLYGSRDLSSWRSRGRVFVNTSIPDLGVPPPYRCARRVPGAGAGRVEWRSGRARTRMSRMPALAIVGSQAARPACKQSAACTLTNASASKPAADRSLSARAGAPT